MKRLITISLIVLVVLGTAGVLWVAKAWTLKRMDEKVLKFNADCDTLILGIQQYKEFVGTYPIGNNGQIVKSLLGQTDKKVLILAVRRSDLNDKGEIVDPWGTPLGPRPHPGRPAASPAATHAPSGSAPRRRPSRAAPRW